MLEKSLWSAKPAAEAISASEVSGLDISVRLRWGDAMWNYVSSDITASSAYFARKGL
jgi:hypothetical protein